MKIDINSEFSIIIIKNLFLNISRLLYISINLIIISFRSILFIFKKDFFI